MFNPKQLPGKQHRGCAGNQASAQRLIPSQVSIYLPAIHCSQRSESLSEQSEIASRFTRGLYATSTRFGLSNTCHNEQPCKLKMEDKIHSGRHRIEEALDLPLTENWPPEKTRGVDSAAHVSGGVAACAPVEQWREPRTVTTLSWLDGHVSRAYVTMRGDALAETDRARANQARGCPNPKPAQMFCQGCAF